MKRSMKTLTILMGAQLAGCGSVAKTEIDPSTSSVKTKYIEKRPVTTETTTITISPQAETYRLIIKEQPCVPSPSPSSAAAASPQPVLDKPKN